jgi:nucleotide-binding universal stress UspA family protein
MGSIPEGESKSSTVLVVGVDFSEFAPHVLTVARNLVAAASDAVIHVVTVIKPQSIPPDVVDAIPSLGPSTEAAIRRTHQDLKDLCTATLGSDMNVMLHVRIGRPAEEIVQLSEDVEADVIVIEAHSRTGLAKLFHRSVAAELSRTAPCSVLTVRTKRERVSRPIDVAREADEEHAIAARL